MKTFPTELASLRDANEMGMACDTELASLRDVDGTWWLHPVGVLAL